MLIFYMVFSGLLIVLSVLPFIQSQHWIFRVAEFVKLQLLVFQVPAFALGFYLVGDNSWIWGLQGVQSALIVYHAYILIRYTKFWRQEKYEKGKDASDSIKVISCNVLQFNTAYHRFIELIQKEQPHIFLTMESDATWEKALRVLEKDYPNFEKVTLDNTYGMHFYTNLKIKKCEVHYFVADDIPSIEAELETADGHRFIFFAVRRQARRKKRIPKKGMVICSVWPNGFGIIKCLWLSRAILIMWLGQNRPSCLRKRVN